MDNNLTCLVVARYEYRAGVPRLKAGGKEYTVAEPAAVTRNGDVLEGLTAESELLEEDGTRVALGSLLGSWNTETATRMLIVGLNEGAEGHYEIGVEDYITLPFSTAEPVYLRLGDWADLTPVMDDGTAGQFGKRYEVCDFPKPELNTSTGGYDYELRLDAYYMKWKNKIFRYIAQAVSLGEEAQGEASWSLTATLDVHLEVLLRNLTALGYTYGGEAFAYGIDWDYADTEARYISYSDVNIIDGLSLMADSFHCEWWMEDNRIRFGRLEHSDLVQVRAGVEAETMKRTDSSGTYATRIYAFGAERNLQSDYRSTADEVTVGGVVQRRLMLPEDVPYVDAWRYDASGRKVYTTGYKTDADGNKVYIGDTGYGDLEGEVTLCGYRVTQGTDSDGNVTLTKEYVTEEEYAALTTMAVAEAVEAVVTTDDIYPRTKDEVKAVSVYWKMFDRSDESDQGTLVYDDIDPVYKDTAFDPDTYIAEHYPDSTTLYLQPYYRVKSTFFGDDGFKHAYILSAETLGLKFSSGRLNGLEFDVMFLGASGDTDTEYTSPDGTQWFELVANESYGSLLPSEALRPEEGDGFVLYNWQAVDTSTGEITDATKKMIAEAERELLGYTVEYLRDTMVDDGVYECDMHPGYVYAGGSGSLRIARAFTPGQRILLVNDALFDIPRESRVVGFTVNLDIPYDHPVYKVGESVKYSRIGDVEDKVSELVYNGNSYTTSGSGSAGVYLIKTNDSTAATNYNVYSALRTLNSFLRKDKDDSTDYGLTTKKGFYVGDFVSGSSGASIFQDSETGETTAEVDRIYVRLKAYFEQLETVNVDSVSGKQVITPGGSVKIISVEETEDAYRCHFLAEQEGEKVENRFAVGDQAYSQNFNAREGVENLIANHYYWRLVTAVGEDYIDLSKTDCDTDSDAPVAGDTVCQLGARDDSGRKNALIFSSVDSFSPSITLYEGIDSYSLSGKDVVSFGVDKTTGKAFFNVYGDMYIGDRDGKAYVKFVQEKDPDTGEVTSSEVEIKGKLGVGTTLSDGSVLEETFPKIFTKQPTDEQSYSVGDMWLNATYGDKYSNDMLYAVEGKAAGEAFSIDHWALSSDYNNWKQYAYLKKALQEYTSIDGGLIQSSVLALGYTEEESGEYKVMSGTSGIYDADALGGGIASWWGGAMKDKDAYTSENMPDDVAKALIRMDGTGYLAGGALWWESDGKIHADPQSFIIRENQLGDYLALFQIVYKTGSTDDIDYVIPQYSFQKLDIGSTGLNEISDGVLYIDGDLVVKGGITMYAQSGEYEASTWLDLLPVDESTLSKEGGVLSVIGGAGSGLEGIIVNGSTYTAEDGYITLPDYASSWNDLTDKPSWLSSTVGGAAKPVYISSGVPTACSSTVGSATAPVYMSSGTITACGSSLAVDITGNAATATTATKLGSTTVGGAAKPIYLSSGTATACSSTVGSSTAPVYMSSGTITACGSSLAVDITGNAATATTATKLGSSTVGGAAKPIYLSSGTATACSSTVGSSTAPVYMSSGTITACGSSLAVDITGNAATATSATTATTATTATKLGSTTVGSSTAPIYLSSGTATACGSSLAVDITGNAATATSATTATTATKLGSTTVGGAAKPIYLSSGTATACSSTVGSSTAPVYMSSGTITACGSSLAVDITGNAATATTATKLGSSTVGGAAKPIYLSSGTATACSSTVGGSTAPVYMSSGTITACGSSLAVDITGNAATATTATTATKLGSSTVGGTAKPIYLSSGTPTACSSTVGGSTAPVYMSSGTITACGSTLAVDITGTASYATTTADTSDTLYLLGVTSSATTTLKRNAYHYVQGDTLTTGNILATGYITMYYESDRRLKTNVRPVTAAARRLAALGAVYDFDYVEGARVPYRLGHTGFMYQDLARTAPDLTRVGADGFGAVNYMDPTLVSLCCAAAVEHETRLQALERENEELRARIKELERRAA